MQQTPGKTHPLAPTAPLDNQGLPELDHRQTADLDAASGSEDPQEPKAPRTRTAREHARLKTKRLSFGAHKVPDKGPENGIELRLLERPQNPDDQTPRTEIDLQNIIK